ncbi:conserved protein, unknown function [Plasmodium yoelii]|uniref:Uncharacterized protein n=2 Tax=Plasmodium yoelii TaxID=5861 RepID=A0AAE9WRF6_PLAYO|nr:conserved protein, unknown function [Plasmodium yoelii]WBY55697.1 hypothetical protein Py17XNL_000504527 [Plasmodium yoelii yoelii]CDU16761.1 conserved Plasmodium protein, unknown function [Plasmodium yoelii]VTZ74348.1 conserved protein, unknown function [Plasmodium yoelii]|eukprot:XP_022811689.1 conserved protein, unknown function [Plasmodium yoelii]
MMLFGRRQIIERNYNIKKKNFNDYFFLNYYKYSTKNGIKFNNEATELNKENFENQWKKIIKKDYVNRITNIFENNNTNDIKKNCFYFILGPKGVGKKFFIEKSKEIFLNREIQSNEEKKSINIKRKKYNEENMGYDNEAYIRKINVDGMNKVRKQNIFFEYDFKSKCENNVMPFSMVIYNLENFLRHKLLKEMNNDIKNKNIKLEDIYKEIINTNYNDIISLTKIKDFFKDILNKKNEENGENEENIYDYLNDIDKSTIENYIMLIETNKFSYDNLKSFLNILLKNLNTNVFCSFLNEFSSFLYFLKLISQYEEQLYYSKNSQNVITHYLSSGLYIYKYFLLLIKLLKDKYNYNFFFIFYNFNLLFIGPQPCQNFQFFYNFMEENLRKYNIPVIVHSIKNLEMMKTIFLYNNYVNNLFYKLSLNYDKNKNVSKSTNIKEINYSKMNYNIPIDKIASSSNNTEYYNDELKEIQKKISINESENCYEIIKDNIIEIENMSYDIVKFILMPNFINKEEICKCLYEIIGGNIELIKIVCKGLYNLNNEFTEKKIWEEIEKEKKENITYDMDEEPDISRDNTIEEIINYKKIEKQYNFLKNIHQNVLHTFILDFEKKIINFFSLPHIEKMKENHSYNVDEKNNINKKPNKCKEDNFEKRGLNYVEFHFTIFEVIRYFIKKKKVFCKNILKLNNPVLLGLIDVNIIHYNYSNKYLELTNKFYEVLLLNYINFRYNQFPLKFKAQYNINYVLNYNTIKHEYNLLETQT